MTAQIIFVEVQRSNATIDAQTDTDGLRTFKVVLPKAGWGAVARWMLSDWAAASGEVNMVFRQAHGCAQVQISDDQWLLLLDLEPTPGGDHEDPLLAALAA